MELFLNLLLSHLMGDFWLQTDKLCEHKRKFGLRSWFLYLHSLIIGLLTYVLSNAYASFWRYALIIMIIHWLIDAGKTYIKRCPLTSFCVDQLLHAGVLLLVSQWYLEGEGVEWTQFSFIPFRYGIKLPLLCCAVVVCCGMANVLVKLVLERFQINLPKSKGNNLDKAGALIGNLERLICLILVIVGQFEAIGFIFAAKSILRFKDNEHSKTEYVLAGSLLSFAIALLCGLALRLSI